MNILHLANTPLSNAPANIASCQNHLGHKSRVLLQKKAGRNKVHVGGETWEGMGVEKLITIFEAADIIHFHNFTWTQAIFAQWPCLLEIAKKKSCFVQFHSPRKAHEDFEEVLRDPYFDGRRMVVAQYHPREYKECEWLVPNPLPLHEPRFTKSVEAKWLDVPPIQVSYAPSNQHLRGWDYKGYDQIVPALKELRDHAISPDVIINTPYEECLTRKSWAHVGIEEFFTGSYHLSLLEYMALECVPLGYLDSLTREALRYIVGEGDDIPIVEVRDAGEMTKALTDLSMNPARVMAEARDARAWIHRNWSPEKTMRFFDKAYQSV